MILHNRAPYAINVNKLKSLTLACPHIVMLLLSSKAVGYSSLSVNILSYFFISSYIHSFIYFIVSTYTQAARASSILNALTRAVQAHNRTQAVS